MALDEKFRYLQIAFNYDLVMALRILPTIPHSDKIMIEAGTPLIKREGMSAIRSIRKLWPGYIVADMKTDDGALGEAEMAAQAGANAATIMGSSPIESLNLFIQSCSKLGMEAMVDMMGVKDPLGVLRQLHVPPAVVILHRGRDEETTRGKVIEYRNVNRIHSKYDMLISAAGGVDLKEARSAVFNGASIVVVNLVRPGDPWQGIRTDTDIAAMAREFLATLE